MRISDWSSDVCSSDLGSEPGLTIILFTLDEDSYSRELAPLAGHYPALRIGPPWWFNDSPEGMRRFRERVTETAGFRSEEHTSELQSLMRTSYAVFCLKKNKHKINKNATA